MANTSFNGPVRSEKGFQQINKAASTGVITKRFLGTKPDLTSLTATVVTTNATRTYTANVITVNNYTGAAAQAVTLPAATVGVYVVHAQSDDTTGGVATLKFTCAGSDVYRTGSKMESRATGAVQTISTSAATNTVLTYTPANAATNSLTHGCYLYFTCFEKGIWNFAYDLATGNTADTGAAAWS